MNALTQTEQAEEYINRFALRELVEEWLSRASVECPEDPYQYLIDEATDQRRSGGGIVTCDNKWCGATMPASRFAAHQETCNNAASWVRCVRCNTRVDASKMSQHRMFCKLERCTLCGEMVLPRMLPMCPYRKVAKAERDRQAAMHRKERRLERQALERGEAVPLLTDAAAPASPQHASPTAAVAREATSPSSGRAIPQSQTPLSSPVSATPAAAAAAPAQFPEAAAVQPIMVNSSSPSSVFAPAAGAAVVVVESEGAGGATPRRNKAVAGSGTAAAGAEAAVPRPSFPAFTAADAELREKLESYPDQLLPPLTTIQIFWRRNMALHLFREQVFGAVWRHMDSAQEGAGGQSKEGAAIRLVERNLRSDRRISSVDENGVTTSAAAAAAATAAAKTAAEGDAGDPSLRDGEFCADEVPVASFQSDPVTVSESQLSHGGYMRVRDYEALTRHCQAREVLQFSVVLKIVRAATKLLRERPLVQHIAIPANSSLVVVGDLHGQMKDLEYILNYMGTPSPERSYLFNGDFIDRGPYGCEVLMVIYGLLCTYPDYVYVNRGNHENYSTNTEYGFMAELYAKYAGRASYLLDAMTDSYEVMSLMSIVDNRVAVVHGGVPRLECKLAEIEEIGHVRDIPVEQQSTRAEQLLAELLWNDPVEKFRSRQLGLNHQGEGWRSSSRGCGVEYLTSITEQFLKINDLKLVIRSHDVKTAGFELVHKNKSITVFSASNYGGVSGNRGAVAVLTPEAVQPVFHTWFLKEDYREHQQDNFFEGNMDVFFQDDRTRLRTGGGGATSPHKAEGLQAAAAGEAPQLDSATGAMVVVGPDGHAVAAAAAGNALGGGMGGAVPQQQQPPKRVNAAMIAEASLMDGDEYICAYYLASGGVLDEEDLWSDTSSRSSAFSESEERANSDSPNASTDAPSAGASTSLSAASAAAARTTVGRSRASPPLGKPHNSNAAGAVAAVSVAGGAGGSSAGQQRWPAGGATANNGSNARLSPGGQRGTRLSLTSHGSSAGAQGLSRAGCALAQDMSIVIQLQTLQQIRELIYFQRYALLVAFNQVDEMQTGTVYKAEWCVVMRDVLKLDIPWYYLCQFLVPRLVVDGVPSVEYMRFLRHFDVCFALDFRLSWQKSTIQRISGGLDLPDDIISAFCERPAVGGSGANNRNAMDASVQLSPGEPPSAATLAERAGGELGVTSSLAMAATTALDSSAAAAAGQSPPTTITSLEASWDVPSIGANAGAAPQPTMMNGYVDDDDDEDEDDWWCDVQLDFKTFATKVRVLSPAAAAMEDNEIFALFCFFDVSLQGHVYVGDMVESITAVMDEEGSVDEAELLVSGEIDFSAVAGGGRSDNANHPRSPSSSSYSSSSSSSSSSDSASPRQQPASDAETRADNNNGGGGRNLFASKMTMTGMKSRLMRPPTPSSEEEGGGGDDGEAAGSSGSLTGNERDRDASFAARAFSPTAPASRADAYPSPLNDPPLSSAPTAANFLATVDSTGVAAVGDAASTVMDSASCSGSRRTQPGEAEGGAPPPLPHHQPCPLGRLSDASDAEGSVASTRPAASTRSSDGGSPGATTLPATARKSDPLSTEDERADSSDSGSSPRLSSKTSRVRSVDDSPAHGPAVGVLPLEYEEDESEPEEADATVLPASSSSHGEAELWASTTLAPTAVPPPPPPPPPQPQPVPSPPRASSMTPSLLSPTAADKLFFAKAGVAGGVEFINAVQRLDAEGAAERSARGDDSREDAEDDAVSASAALSAPAGSATAAVSGNGGSGIQGSSAAAPRTLHRSHSFNEYATSVTSNGSTSAAGMAMSRPFDDYNTNLFNANADTPSSGTGAGGAGGVAGSVKGGASSSSNGGSKSARIEQRVTKRLAMPPWIYPTLLRVQEQLLGGYMRLRFLFQALNRSRTGHLTEAEFLPLMEFMNCLLEHPLSGEQAHLLFVCVHDSAIRYVQAMRTRRRQRAGSVYADTVDLTGLRRQTSGAGAEPASDSDSAGSYARHRALDEQMRGECYILLVEFLAFFCVKPVQYEDEVEALEELLYEAAGGHASTTAASSFKDAMRQRSTDGVEGPRSFIPTGWDAARDDSAGVSMSSVSVTLSGGVQPSLWKGGEAVAWGQPVPAPIRLQRSAVEVVAPLPADGAPAGDGAAAAAAVTLPPPPPPPLSMSGRPSDSPSTAGFSASRGRGSSWGTPDNMSAMVPATTVGGFLLASPSAGRLSPRQRLSSVTIQSGGELAGSGSARGSLTGANNSSSNSHSGHADWLSAQRTGNGGAATALADSAAESDDAAGLRGVVAVSVAPAAQTDLLSALAALGGAYGENITVKELMQRLAARHHRSSRAALPTDPSLAGHPQPRSHTLPLVLGANSLMSFVSGSSDDSGHDVGDAAAGNDTSPSASSSSASSSRRRQSRHRHHKRHQVPPVASQPAPQPHEAGGRRDSPGATAPLRSPLSVAPTPTLPMVSGAGSTALLRTASGHTYTVLLQARSGNGPELEFSLSSVQPVVSSQQQHQHRSNSRVLTTPSPPAAQAMPMPSAGRSINSNASHHQRTSSLLEGSVASVSHRPYMLNRVTEQRVTVLSANAFAAHYGGQTPQPPPLMLSPGTAASIPSSFNVANDSNASSTSSGLDLSGKRGVADAGRGQVMGVVGIGGSRLRQRLKSQRSTKQGAAVFVASPNLCPEGELTSLSLVPSLVLPPAPPTRQLRRPFANGSSANASVMAKSGNASTVESRVAATAEEGGQGVGSSTGASQPPLLPSAQAAASLLSGGAVSSAEGGASASSTRTTPSQGTSGPAAAAVVAVPPSPTRPAASRVASQRPAGANGSVSGGGQPGHEKERPASEAAGNSPAGAAAGATAAGPVVSTAASATPSAAAAVAPEPSRAKARLDSSIATAKALQSTSAASPPAAPPRREKRPSVPGAASASTPSPSKPGAATGALRSGNSSATAAASATQHASLLSPIKAADAQQEQVAPLMELSKHCPTFTPEMLEVMPMNGSMLTSGRHPSNGGDGATQSFTTGDCSVPYSGASTNIPASTFTASQVNRMGALASASGFSNSAVTSLYVSHDPAAPSLLASGTVASSGTTAVGASPEHGSNGSGSAATTNGVASVSAHHLPASKALPANHHGAASTAKVANSARSSSSSSGTTATATTGKLPPLSSSSGSSSLSATPHINNAINDADGGGSGHPNTGNSSHSAASSAKAGTSAAGAATAAGVLVARHSSRNPSLNSSRSRSGDRTAGMVRLKPKKRGATPPPSASAALAAPSAQQHRPSTPTSELSQSSTGVRSAGRVGRPANKSNSARQAAAAQTTPDVVQLMYSKAGASGTASGRPRAGARGSGVQSTTATTKSRDASRKQGHTQSLQSRRGSLKSLSSILAGTARVAPMPPSTSPPSAQAIVSPHAATARQRRPSEKGDASPAATPSNASGARGGRPPKSRPVEAGEAAQLADKVPTHGPTSSNNAAAAAAAAPDAPPRRLSTVDTLPSIEKIFASSATSGLSPHGGKGGKAAEQAKASSSSRHQPQQQRSSKLLTVPPCNDIGSNLKVVDDDIKMFSVSSPMVPSPVRRRGSVL